ncbi:YggT family protein [Clostridium fermenticellae]|uniref:YggT family protein n=1 Tax=Clostridium fermenticellae TaxID=2068654 RepID=A0A386H4N7_9CLOT|nr:YggT family protein [Clostridium fermenticellae]AYD40626.1 YggT family protein [Clostridium fermenticellae]
MITNTLSMALSLLFRFIEAAIILDVIFSWIMPGRSNALLDIIHVFTEPFMMPGRKLQEKIMPGLMIDFSPIVALLILDLLERIVFSIL